MRKFVLSMFVVFSVLLSGNLCFAASGSAVMPVCKNYKISNQETYNSIIYLSNITGASIDIKITIFNYDGSVVKDPASTLFRVGNVSSFNGNPTSNNSATFTVAANNSAYFIFENATSSSYGYAIIEWTQDSNVIYGLLCHAREFHYRDISPSITREYAYSIPINGGQPF